MILKYDANIEDDAIAQNLARITNQIYKLLPNREEGLDWQKPLQTLIIELAGMDRLITGHVTLFPLLCKLEALLTMTEEKDFFNYRKTIFECLGLIGSLKNNNG